MAIVVKKSASGGNYPQTPAGVYRGVLREIKDLGIRTSKEGKPQHRGGLVFDLDAHDETGKSYDIVDWLNLVIHERSTLAQRLQEWLDIPFESIPDGFDLESLIHRPARIRVAQKRGQQGDLISYVKSIEPVDDNSGALSTSQPATSNSDLPDDDPFNDDV